MSAERFRDDVDGDADDEAFELQHLPKTSSDLHKRRQSEDDDDEDDELELEEDELKRDSVSSDHSFQLYTPDEERRVLKKLDTRVVLFMSFLYMLAFLDRSNIGNAKIAGLEEDLNLQGDQFDWLLTAFYVTYIGFEWMILMYHYLTPHVYIAICVMSWGLVASLQAITTSFWQMMILRLLLGLAEAAFSPGVPFYLSFFFRREELAFRAGIQISAAPLAASFAGSLAWAITKWGQNSFLAPWRLLFLVEGFPCVVVAVFAWSFVPDSPETAKFLTPRERRVAKLRLRNEYASVKGGSKTADLKQILETLKDPKCYLTALMFLNCNIAFSSMPVFLPSVLNEMGYSSISSQGLSAPPFLLSFFVLLITAKLSDRMKTRSLFVFLAAMLSFVGYGLIALGGWLQWPNFVRYLFVYLAAPGFFSAITIIITWTMNNQESNAKKGTGMTILNLIGQCGPLLGTRLYPDSDKPYYVTGMAVCAGAMLVVAVLAIVLRVILIAENKKRARVLQREAEIEDELLDRGKKTGHLRREEFVLML